jgi:pyrroloquinoline quinone biosynthesis protein D
MERLCVSAASRLVLPRHVKLKHDKVRDRWILLAPERVLDPDETALEIVRLLDGTRTVEGIVQTLAEKYAAPRDLIFGDVVALLQDLADKGFLVETAAAPATAGRSS